LHSHAHLLSPRQLNNNRTFAECAQVSPSAGTKLELEAFVSESRAIRVVI
jgi:hypothetical protein